MEVLGVKHAFSVAFGIHIVRHTCKDLCFTSQLITGDSLNAKSYNSGVKCVYGVIRRSYKKILS